MHCNAVHSLMNYHDGHVANSVTFLLTLPNVLSLPIPCSPWLPMIIKSIFLPRTNYRYDRISPVTLLSRRGSLICEELRLTHCLEKLLLLIPILLRLLQ